MQYLQKLINFDAVWILVCTVTMKFCFLLLSKINVILKNIFNFFLKKIYINFHHYRTELLSNIMFRNKEKSCHIMLKLRLFVRITYNLFFNFHNLFNWNLRPIAYNNWIGLALKWKNSNRHFYFSKKFKHTIKKLSVIGFQNCF